MTPEDLIVAAAREHFKFNSIRVAGGLVEYQLLLDWYPCALLTDFGITLDKQHYHIYLKRVKICSLPKQ